MSAPTQEQVDAAAAAMHEASAGFFNLASWRALARVALEAADEAGEQ